MFAELERRIADKRAAGIDVISLGIGDPDEPTYPHIVEAMQEAVAEPGNQKYPSNRGRAEFRKMAAEHETWITDMFADLGEKDVRELMRLLAKTKASARKAAECKPV